MGWHVPEPEAKGVETCGTVHLAIMSPSGESPIPATKTPEETKKSPLIRVSGWSH